MGRVCSRQLQVCRVGQNRIYTPYMTVYLVDSLQKIPYMHRIYIYIYIYIWFWPTLQVCVNHPLIMLGVFTLLAKPFDFFR
jgi:hypothetical protein